MHSTTTSPPLLRHSSSSFNLKQEKEIRKKQGEQENGEIITVEHLVGSITVSGSSSSNLLAGETAWFAAFGVAAVRGLVREADVAFRVLADHEGRAVHHLLGDAEEGGESN